MFKVPSFFNGSPIGKRRASESGFTYIEVIISMIVMTVGILGAMSALTYSLLYMQESEKRTQAKQIADSTLETIFAVRDIRTVGALSIDSWNSIQNKASGNDGIFLPDWTPVRQSSGDDGIYGTDDDACAGDGSCSTSPIIQGYERKIEISDIVENGSPVIRKRRIDVTIRYRVNNSNFRTEKVSTIISKLPFN